MDYLSLCLTCKDENDYLPEWLDYHILMGVDRFYIYDNESQVSLRETLKEYVERGWVVVLDISGKAMQLYAYDHCLQTFGPQTFWMGFIDTDEFLVPKTTLDLKELLQNYETYAGLAVSSLFFGSNDHQVRPFAGQIASYTRRTHETFKENELVKCIVQPSMVKMTNSPHDFTFKENTWCVNEGLLRVDGQHFPNHTDKIQLNHYFCRSEREIDLKLRRGNSGAIDWPRKRFDVINLMAVYDDTYILQNLNMFFQQAAIDSLCMVEFPQAAGLLEKIAFLARTRCPAPLEISPASEAKNFRIEFNDWMDLKAKGLLAKERGDYQQVCQMLLSMIQSQPQYPKLYVDLCINRLHLGDPQAAWQALTRAWQLAPNTYAVLGGMALYFLWMKNFVLVEKTCHLILEIAPHNLMALGHLTEALLGQARFEDALSVGVPVVALSAQVGELPDGVGVFLIKRMADYLLEKQDFSGAVRLWKAGVQCQPGDVNVLLELSRAMLLAGDKTGARQRLVQAQALAPQNKEVLALFLQAKDPQPEKHKHR